MLLVDFLRPSLAGLVAAMWQGQQLFDDGQTQHYLATKQLNQSQPNSGR